MPLLIGCLQKDVFLYAVIVPVIPFALTERAGVEQDKGNAQHA